MLHILFLQLLIQADLLHLCLPHGAFDILRRFEHQIEPTRTPFNYIYLTFVRLDFFTFKEMQFCYWSELWLKRHIRLLLKIVVWNCKNSDFGIDFFD